MDYAIDNSFYMKAKALLDKVEQNQRLQQLAMSNGIDVKNSTKLSDATKDNVATAVIALLLAKHNNDPRYNDLVRYGMDHRKTKIEIINDYKDQANQIITRAKNGNVDELSGFTESYMESDDTDIEVYQEGLIGGILLGVTAAVVFIGAVVIDVIKFIINLICGAIKALVNLITGKKSIRQLINKLEKINDEYDGNLWIYNFAVMCDGNDVLKRVKNKFGESSPLYKALTYGRTTSGYSIFNFDRKVLYPIALSALVDMISNYTLENYDGTEKSINENEKVWDQFGMFMSDITREIDYIEKIDIDSSSFKLFATIKDMVGMDSSKRGSYIPVDQMLVSLEIMAEERTMNQNLNTLKGLTILSRGLTKYSEAAEEADEKTSSSERISDFKYWASVIRKNTNSCSKLISKSSSNMTQIIYKLLKYGEADLKDKYGGVNNKESPSFWIR